MPPRKSKPPKSPLDGKQYDYYRGDYDLDDVSLLPGAMPTLVVGMF